MRSRRQPKANRRPFGVFITPDFRRNVLALAMGQALLLSAPAHATYNLSNTVMTDNETVTVSGSYNYQPVYLYSAPLSNISVLLDTAAELDAWIDLNGVKDSLTITLGNNAQQSANGQAIHGFTNQVGPATQAVTLNSGSEVNAYSTNGPAGGVNLYSVANGGIQTVSLDDAAIQTHTRRNYWFANYTATGIALANYSDGDTAQQSVTLGASVDGSSSLHAYTNSYTGLAGNATGANLVAEGTNGAPTVQTLTLDHANKSDRYAQTLQVLATTDAYSWWGSVAAGSATGVAMNSHADGAATQTVSLTNANAGSYNSGNSLNITATAHVWRYAGGYNYAGDAQAVTLNAVSETGTTQSVTLDASGATTYSGDNDLRIKAVSGAFQYFNGFARSGNAKGVSMTGTGYYGANVGQTVLLNASGAANEYGGNTAEIVAGTGVSGYYGSSGRALDATAVNLLGDARGGGTVTQTVTLDASGSTGNANTVRLKAYSTAYTYYYEKAGNVTALNAYAIAHYGGTATQTLTLDNAGSTGGGNNVHIVADSTGRWAGNATGARLTAYGYGSTLSQTVVLDNSNTTGTQYVGIDAGVHNNQHGTVDAVALALVSNGAYSTVTQQVTLSSAEVAARGYASGYYATSNATAISLNGNGGYNLLTQSVTLSGNGASGDAVYAYATQGMARGIQVSSSFYNDNTATIGLTDANVRAAGGHGARAIDIVQARQATVTLGAGSDVEAESGGGTAYGVRAVSDTYYRNPAGTTFTLSLDASTVGADGRTAYGASVAGFETMTVGLANGAQVHSYSGSYYGRSTGLALSEATSATVTLDGGSRLQADAYGPANGRALTAGSVQALTLSLAGASTVYAQGGNSAVAVQMYSSDATINLDGASDITAVNNGWASGLRAFSSDVTVSLLGGSSLAATSYYSNTAAASGVFGSLAVNIGGASVVQATARGQADGVYSNDQSTLTVALDTGSTLAAETTYSTASGVNALYDGTVDVTLVGGSGINAHSANANASAVRVSNTNVAGVTLGGASSIQASTDYGSDVAGVRFTSVDTGTMTLGGGSLVDVSGGYSVSNAVGLASLYTGDTTVTLSAASAVNVHTGSGNVTAVKVTGRYTSAYYGYYYSYPASTTGKATISLTDASLTAANAPFNEYSNATAIALQDLDTASVHATNSSLVANSADGDGFGITANNVLALDVTLDGGTVIQSTTGTSGFWGILVQGGGTSTITLDNAVIDATNVTTYGTGIAVYGGNAATISLSNGSAIRAAGGMPANVGIEVGGATATISIDATSSVSGPRAVVVYGPTTGTLTNLGTVSGTLSAISGNVDVTNNGVVSGNVSVTSFTQSATGTLEGTLDVPTSQVSPLWSAGTMSLADGSKVRVVTTDALMSQLLTETTPRDYLLAQAGTLTASAPALVLQTNPYMHSVLDGSTANELHLSVGFSCDYAGLSPNGVAACEAAQKGGGVQFDFHSSADEWAPLSGDMTRAGPRFVGRLLDNGLGKRLDLVTGDNSGDPAAMSRVWVDARSMTATQDATSSSVGFDTDASAVTFGLDTAIEDSLVMGIAATRAKGSVDQAASINRLNSTGALFSLYGRWTSGRLAVDMIGTSGSWANDASRIAGTEHIKAGYDSLQRSIGATARMGFGSEGWQFAPQLAFQYQTLKVDEYDERGNGTPSSLALEVERQNYDDAEAGVGVVVSKDIVIRHQAGTWTPSAELMFWNDGVKDRTVQQAAFATGSGDFRAAGIAPKADRAALSLGLQYATESNMLFSVGADLEGNADFQSRTWSAKFQYRY